MHLIYDPKFHPNTNRRIQEQRRRTDTALLTPWFDEVEDDDLRLDNLGEGTSWDRPPRSEEE